MTDASVPPPGDRADTIARAKALAQRRTAAPANSSTPARILVAGTAASAALMLVGVMAASARETPPTPAAVPEIVERVVTIQLPPPTVAPTSQVAAVRAAPVEEQVTIVREVRVLPAPAANPVPAPAPTQGS